MFRSRSRLAVPRLTRFSRMTCCATLAALGATARNLPGPEAGRRFLFSDALAIGGMISHEEVAARSAIGYYLFSPPGENERLLRDTGFQRIEVLDTTASAAEISTRWHNARKEHSEALAAIEGRANFEGLQKFLATVEKLSRERRLLRLLYLAEKPAN